MGKAPAVSAGFVNGDGDAEVIWFPGGWASSDELGVKKFILIVLVVDILVKEFVLIIKVGVPLSSELSAGL